jgi:hypothetical protein
VAFAWLVGLSRYACCKSLFHKIHRQTTQLARIVLRVGRARADTPTLCHVPTVATQPTFCNASLAANVPCAAAWESKREACLQQFPSPPPCLRRACAASASV